VHSHVEVHAVSRARWAEFDEATAYAGVGSMTGRQDEASRSRGATLKDVARIAGVHPGTASRALDPTKMWLVAPKTRARIEAAARQLGYRPDIVARSLRSGSTKTIGVIVADLSNAVVSEAIHGVAEFLFPRGYMPLIIETFDDPDRLVLALDALRSRRVDAVIITAARAADTAVIRSMVREGLRVVLAVRPLPGLDVPTVVHDDAHGGRLVAEHLLGLGHRVLGELRGTLDAQPFAERGRGFRQAVAAGDGTLVEVADVAAHPNAEEGRRLIEFYLASEGDLPTAFFAHNDAMAIGAIDALRQAGLRCPEDVSVVGYNDAPLSDHVVPPLTTVRYPFDIIGRFAAEVALSHIEDHNRPGVRVSFPAELIVRGSTAPVPSRANVGAG
jgi:LacI family transcriptional regulator, galactose operon repressor